MNKIAFINIKYPIAVIVVFLFFVIWGSVSVRSYANPVENKEEKVDTKPLDFHVQLSKKTFLAQSEEYVEEPFGDKALAYKVYLPKSWAKVSSDKLKRSVSNQRLLGDVVRYVSPPINDDRASFSIKALNMTRLMDVEHWFIHQMSVRGLYIDGIKVFSRDLVHAEYNIFENERYYSVRGVAQRNGNRIVLSEYKVPLSLAEKYKNFQRWSISSFRLSNVVQDMSSLVDSYSYLNKVSHYYPQAWISNSSGSISADEVSVNFGRPVSGGKDPETAKIDRPKGFIQTFLLSKSSTEDIDSKIKKLILNFNAVAVDIENVKGVLQRDKMNKDRTVVFHPIERYGVLKDESSASALSYEFWSTYNETASYYFVTFMLMPEQQYNYPLWSENVATHDLVLRSFGLGKKITP